MKRLSQLLMSKKRIMMVLFLSLGIISIRGYSQTEGDETQETRTKYKVKKKELLCNNVISFYPITAMANYMTIGYEFKTGDKTAFKTVAGYAKTEQNLLSYSDVTDFSGYSLEMQFKKFIRKKEEVFNGPYIAPFAQYKAANFTWEGNKEETDPITGVTKYHYMKVNEQASAFYAGLMLGIHSRLGENFTLDMYWGQGIMFSNGDYKDASRFLDVYTNAMRMRLGFSFGYGF